MLVFEKLLTKWGQCCCVTWLIFRDWLLLMYVSFSLLFLSFFLSRMTYFSPSQECLSPFDFCDIVTTTTHKTLRGPRSGMIFFRRGDILDKDGFFSFSPLFLFSLSLLLAFFPISFSFLISPTGKSTGKQYDFESRINFSVFPGTQGGPHMNTIAAVATALREASTPEFKLYIQQVKKNIQTLAAELVKGGHKVTTGGTDNHLLVWDLRAWGITGSKVEEVWFLILIRFILFSHLLILSSFLFLSFLLSLTLPLLRFAMLLSCMSIRTLFQAIRALSLLVE